MKHLSILGICLTIAACNSSSSSSADSGSSGGGGVADKVPFSAWISSTQAQVTFTDPSNDLTANYVLYSSQDPSCDIASIVSCSQGQQTTLDTFPASVTIDAWTLTTPAYYILENRDKDTTTDRIVPSPIFIARAQHQLVVFKDNKMYLIGGTDAKSKNDIWRSGNGTDWILMEASADFPVRANHQVVIFKDKMYLIGGVVRNKKNDIWRSSNGTDWTEVTSDAAFPARFGHQLVVFNDRMYIIGGSSLLPDPSTGDNLLYNDVWSSSNGTDWTQDTAHAAFSTRTAHQVVVFDNKLYLIGGYNGNGTNDIWHSSNGIDWTQDTAHAAFSARYNHQIVAFNDRIYVIGGYDGNNKNDVWSSSNGKDWTQDTAHAAFSARYNHRVVVFDNKLYLTGGQNTEFNYNNEIWRSSDGKHWMRGYSGTFVFE